MSAWYEVSNVSDVASPALLLYPDRIAENVRRMIRLVGDVSRLRPHIKTHKSPDVLRIQLDQGIAKFKCATIAEAEMAATTGVPDVLIAYQMLGPNIGRMLELTRKFPATRFSCVVDDGATIRALGGAFDAAGRKLDVYLDLDCGQHRTGVAPGSRAGDLYRLITTTRGLAVAGVHVYDGHIDEPDPVKRTELCETAFSPVKLLRDELVGAGLAVPSIVAGGTPTFPLFAKMPGVECSPGTCVLWDFGYSEAFADMDFLHAAVVLSRIVSKPTISRVCVDAGHKAIAAEKPHPRIKFLNLPGAEAVTHSEEHLVLETPQAPRLAAGECLYGIPRHVCPTVALYSEAVVVRNGLATDRWQIAARKRRLTV